MHTILCGTDLTPRSRPALEAAGALANQLGAREIVLAHVLDPAARELDEGTFDPAHVRASRRLRKLAEQLARSAHLPVRELLLEGSVSGKLLEAAAAEKDPLLVVAAGVDGTNTPLGPTPARILDTASCPVLLVRDPTPFVAWSDVRPLRLVLGIDDSVATREVLWAARRLAAAAKVEVEAVYAWYAGDAARRYGRSIRNVMEVDRELEELVIRDLQHIVGDIPGAAVNLRPRMGFGCLGDHLLEVAKERPADLIVVSTRGRTGLTRFGSASAIALHGSTSILAVPPVGFHASEVLPEVRSVLAATDLSPFSLEAIRHAYGLLGSKGGEVHLVYVAGAEEREEEIRERLAAHILDVPGVRTHPLVIHAPGAAEALCAAAERLGVDSMCIASHGRSGVLRAILGSVAEEILRRSHKPVYVVRPEM